MLRFLYLVAGGLLVSVITCPANGAFVLDFANGSSAGSAQPWGYGATTHSIDATDTGTNTQDPAVPVTFTFTGGPMASQIAAAAIEPGAATPFVSSTSVSGFGEGLIWRIDPPSAIPADDPSGGNYVAPVVLTVGFPVPVYDLSFVIGDLDLGAFSPIGSTITGFQDQVLISGGPTLVVPGNGFVAEAPAGTLTAQPVAGHVDVPDTSDANNVGVSYSGPISSLTLTYQPVGGPTPTSITTQWISVSDMNFSTVPEPSAFLLVGLLGLFAAYRQNRVS